MSNSNFDCTLGNNVKKYRVLRGQTQEDTAFLMDSYISSVRNIETGKDFYITTFLKVIKALNITPNQALNGLFEFNESNVEDSLKEVFLAYDISDAESQKVILDMLKILKNKNTLS